LFQTFDVADAIVIGMLAICAVVLVALQFAAKSPAPPPDTP
jgi:hypothetical protein